jgi:DNA-binding transcriptional ArsR family regulator
MSCNIPGELQGITLNVYLYVAKKGKPVGPRDVMKGATLSSPSVAYRHLQKLEDAGYLTKNEYGEYTVKKKARLKGSVWLGHCLFPKMWVYALIFLGILVVELVILFIHFGVETDEFKVFFLLLTLITGLALAVFAVEGFLQSRRKASITMAE